MRWSFLRRWWDWGGGDELGLGIAMDWSKAKDDKDAKGKSKYRQPWI
jgi:hypothetical protein